MGMMAACGKNLPKVVTAEWENPPDAMSQRPVNPNQDVLDLQVINAAKILPNIATQVAQDRLCRPAT